ncbi:hypothetical protein COOONC_27122 [Cooperia oncophora]
MQAFCHSAECYAVGASSNETRCLLVGEAQAELIKCDTQHRRQLYMLAIDLIKKKYGNKAELVRVLQKRLDNAKADKPSTQGQRKLLEYIIPLVMQLHKLEVNLDGSYNTQKVLSKFTPRITQGP